MTGQRRPQPIVNTGSYRGDRSPLSAGRMSRAGAQDRGPARLPGRPEQAGSRRCCPAADARLAAAAERRAPMQREPGSLPMAADAPLASGYKARQQAKPRAGGTQRRQDGGERRVSSRHGRPARAPPPQQAGAPAPAGARQAAPPGVRHRERPVRRRPPFRCRRPRRRRSSMPHGRRCGRHPSPPGRAAGRSRPPTRPLSDAAARRRGSDRKTPRGRFRPRRRQCARARPGSGQARREPGDAGVCRCLCVLYEPPWPGLLSPRRAMPRRGIPSRGSRRRVEMPSSALS